MSSRASGAGWGAAEALEARIEATAAAKNFIVTVEMFNIFIDRDCCCCEGKTSLVLLWCLVDELIAEDDE
jgi:hypothetical protein